ncbi:DUF1972 domain-containing protein [Parabacteroides goldsteinii]|uniref:DUF1972 domain-containing protein n=1 Tax=Parabacteroides goldsteinii TaxID=328812 RepID=UPI00189AC938|nr:DUF1972 domain-containing protein [Parabacteroides goldsteinii]
MKQIAIIGIQGVPASYGGFESLVENLITNRCSTEIIYTVFCSSKDINKKQSIYKNAILKYIPLRANGLQSILYDFIGLIKTIRGYDSILILGVSGCIFLPLFRILCKNKLIINIDGLEHKRDKWNYFIKKFLLISECFAIKYADIIIADNRGIQEYVKQTYNKTSKLITYGGDHVKRNVTTQFEENVLNKYSCFPYQYSMAICRIEPENNCHIILDAFANSNRSLIFIGNWDKSEYSRFLKAKYANSINITILSPIYDLDILYVLRKNTELYIHGHSAGGTNPSLVEAMFFARPILAYDVIYNRETTNNKALYFQDSKSLKELLSHDYYENTDLVKIAEDRYTWNTIINEYESLY